MLDTTGAKTLALPRPIAFALSGGTSLGAIQLGMVRALLERGIVPDLLVGSSVGAINAALIAGGYQAERIAGLTSLWSRVRAGDVFGHFAIPRYLRVLRGRGSLASPAGLRALVEQHLPARHSELAIPTAVWCGFHRNGARRS